MWITDCYYLTSRLEPLNTTYFSTAGLMSFAQTGAQKGSLEDNSSVSRTCKEGICYWENQNPK